MKKLVPAIATIAPVTLLADALAVIDGGMPARYTGNTGRRENTHNSDIRASREWRSKSENQPSAGFGTFTGTPKSPQPRQPPNYIDTKSMEEKASLPPFNVL
jgi:hypothetical protein